MASIVAITLLIVIEVILSMPIPYISKYLVDVVIGLKKYELVGIVFLVLFIILLLQLLIGNILVRKVARLETNLITEYRKRIVKTIVAKYVLITKKVYLGTFKVIMNNLVNTR